MPATLSVIWYTGLLVCHFAWYAIDNTCIAGTCLLLASLDQRDPIVCLAWLWGPVVVLLAFFLCAAACVLFRTEMHGTFTLFCMAPCLVGLPSEIFYLSELLLIIKRNDINDLFLFGNLHQSCCSCLLAVGITILFSFY